MMATTSSRNVRLIVLVLVVFWKVEWSSAKQDSDEDAKDILFPSDNGMRECPENISTTSSGSSDQVPKVPQKLSFFHFFGLNVTCDLDQMCFMPERKNDVCHCDNECILFGDCCADWYSRKVSKSNMEIMKAIENPYLWFIDNVKDSRHVDTLTTFIQDSVCKQIQNGKDIKAYRVISTCSMAHVDEELRNGCEMGTFHPVENIPVSLRINASIQIVFKNQMCALCYGYKESEVLPWTVSALCPETTLSKTEEYLTKTLKEECTFYMNPPPDVGEIRQCQLQNDQPPLECDDNEQGVNTTMATVCKAYTAPVVSSSLYKNPHCALCSNRSELICKLHNQGSLLPEYVQKIGLNVLFNFNPATGVWYSSEKRECSETKVWYPDKRECYSLLCPKNFLPSFGKCIDDNLSFYNDTYNVPLDLNGEREYNVTIDVSISGGNNSAVPIQKVLQQLSQRLANSGVEIITDFKLIRSSSLKISLDETQMNYRMLVNASTPEELKAVVDDTQDTLRYFNQVYPEMRAEINNVEHTKALKCLRTNITRYTESDLVFIDKSIFYLRPRVSNVTISLDSTRFQLRIESNQPPQLTFLRLCKEGISLQCKLLSYTADEYKLENSTASINNINEIVTNFNLINDILYVCDNLTAMEAKEEVDAMMHFLTVATLTLSIISLCVLLVTYCAFPSLRTLHGKNLMAFSASLLIAQSLFLFGSYAPGTLCVIIAISQHYFWLCTFTWTSTMAFDLASKFSAKTMMTSKTSASQFKKYCFASHGLPMFLVTVCVVVDFYSRDDRIVEYGSVGAGYCWIGNTAALLLAFSLPVVLCLLFNIICFGMSLHGIQGTKKTAKQLRNKKQERNYCIIYTKISILLGGTWLLGLVAAGVNTKPFQYLNICFNGLQGFFLFLGFVVNARVIRMLRRKRMKSSSTMSLQSSEMTDVTRISSVPTQHRY